MSRAGDAVAQGIDAGRAAAWGATGGSPAASSTESSAQFVSSSAAPDWARRLRAEQVRQFESDTPLRRMASVDELVGPAIFLLSDAASFCTGVDLVVDGGFTCW